MLNRREIPDIVPSVEERRHIEPIIEVVDLPGSDQTQVQFPSSSDSGASEAISSRGRRIRPSRRILDDQFEFYE